MNRKTGTRGRRAGRAAAAVTVNLWPTTAHVTKELALGIAESLRIAGRRLRGGDEGRGERE